MNLTRGVSCNRMVASTRSKALLDLAATSVRNIRFVPRTVRVNARTRPRAQLRLTTVELLEGRGLLSTFALVRSIPLELPEVNQAPALVVSSVPRRQDDRSTAPDTTAVSKPAEHDRAEKGNDGNSSDSTPIVRRDSGGSGALRRSNSNNSSERELLDSPDSESHSADLEARALTDDAPLSESEPISGPGSGDSSDPAAAPVAGSALEAGMSAINSAANPSAGASALDPRSGSFAAASVASASTPGSSGPDVAASLVPGPATSPGAHGTASNNSGDQRSDATLPAFSPANLLDAAIHADWEGVNGEFRQFLASLGSFTDSSDGHGSQPAWPLWFGAVTAMLVARRASHRGRRFFGRRQTDEDAASGRCRSQAGPWPLGLP